MDHKVTICHEMKQLNMSRTLHGQLKTYKDLLFIYKFIICAEEMCVCCALGFASESSEIQSIWGKENTTE